jgi:hypothetical protein
MVPTAIGPVRVVSKGCATTENGVFVTYAEYFYCASGRD